jgi:hypothetical protein
MENKKEQKQEETKLRQIIIETDGNNVKLTKSEVAGSLELIAILSSILEQLRK